MSGEKLSSLCESLPHYPIESVGWVVRFYIVRIPLFVEYVYNLVSWSLHGAEDRESRFVG